MAGKVVYSINGVLFESLKAYVSQSHGLISRPKRKRPLSYSWPDENGTEYDLENPLPYEERKISLEMFILGDNWSEIKANFESLVGEFDGAGTQTLTVTPFGLDTMTYEVIVLDEIELEKRFWDGEMVGTFTLNLIEPNPTV